MTAWLGLLEVLNKALQGAGIDPACGNGFGLLLADPSAVHMAEAGRKNRQGAAPGLNVVILPMELGAAVVDVIDCLLYTSDAADE